VIINLLTNSRSYQFTQDSRHTWRFKGGNCQFTNKFSSMPIYSRFTNVIKTEPDTPLRPQLQHNTLL